MRWVIACWLITIVMVGACSELCSTATHTVFSCSFAKSCGGTPSTQAYDTCADTEDEALRNAMAGCMTAAIGCQSPVCSGVTCMATTKTCEVNTSTTQGCQGEVEVDASAR